MWNKETWTKEHCPGSILLVTDRSNKGKRADESQQGQGRTAEDSCTPEAYLESCQTSKAERFAKIVEGF